MTDDLTTCPYGRSGDTCVPIMDDYPCICGLEKRVEAAEQALAVANARKRLFPIQGGDNIPWSIIAPCEAQAQRNHSQTLERLAERGGLDPNEAIWVLNGERWKTEKQQDNGAARLREIVKERWYIPQLEATEAHAERLARALRPFSDYADEIEVVGFQNQCPLRTAPDRLPGSKPTVGNCREARAALAEEPKG